MKSSGLFQTEDFLTWNRPKALMRKLVEEEYNARMYIIYCVDPHQEISFLICMQNMPVFPVACPR